MKTTEQLANECGVRIFARRWFNMHMKELEAFRAAVILDYFESAKPVGEMVSSPLYGLSVPSIRTNLSIGKKLYAAPKEE